MCSIVYVWPSHYHRILEEVDVLPEYYCTASVELFGFSFRTSTALVNPRVLFMMYRYGHTLSVCVHVHVCVCTA